ncbi:hypothetical protein QTP86_020071, partial [Hemibagrus guttatus]
MGCITDTFDQSQSIEKERDAMVCCFIEYLGEPQEGLFQDSQNDQEGHTTPMVEDEPVDVTIVIEGIQVISGCGNKTKACMLLMGLIYALNLYLMECLKKVHSLIIKLMEQSVPCLVGDSYP